MRDRTNQRCGAVTLLTAAFAVSLQAQEMPERSFPTVLKAANSSASASIKFDGIDGEIIASPRDPASGQASGRRQYRPLTARTPLGVWLEFPVVVKRQPSAGPLTIYATIVVDGGGKCRLRTDATFNATAKRFELSLGDAARLFDANEQPRPELCIAG